MICRNCHEETGDEVLVDLGMQPLANSLVLYATDVLGTDQDGFRLEHRYPLAPVICKNWHCRLIQLPSLPPEAIFGKDYPYRSGQSQSWRRHLDDLVQGVLMTNTVRTIVEVGGNDGTLGRLLNRDMDYLNIDPTQPEDGRTICAFMGRELAEDLRPGWADWVVANNVMAHVPDLDDFLAGIRAVMKDDGLLTVEVQDVNQLIERGEWDCIYHEHYSYFNAQTLSDALERRGFFVERVVDIPTHGGSLRAYARKNLQVDHPLHRTPLRIMKPYPVWAKSPEWDIRLARHQVTAWGLEGKHVVGYGAPAKASTWLNACGFNVGDFHYIVDSTPEKQGKYTPGSHIPIQSPENFVADVRVGAVDIVVVLAWNWVSEILPKVPIGPEVWCRGERLR